jgi:hypothetical protein
MKSVSFRFNLDEKVLVEKTGFSGVVTMCAIQGNVDEPEKVYFIQGASGDGWYSERLLKEAE